MKDGADKLNVIEGCDLLFSEASDPMQMVKCFTCGECFGKDLIKAYAWAFNMERFQNIEPSHSYYLWKSLPNEHSRQQAKALAAQIHDGWAAKVESRAQIEAQKINLKPSPSRS